MKIVYFTHSLLSCWNNGNAHFLRGVLRELIYRGHEVRSYEPESGWSRSNLLCETGAITEDQFERFYPDLLSHAHFVGEDLDAMLDGAEVVIVHEWNDPGLIAAIGKRRLAGSHFVLLFHDTHHRAVTEPEAIRQMDLAAFDGILVFGAALAEVYRKTGWRERCFVWHEAADIRLFRPPMVETGSRDGLVWVGNWGDEERSEELQSFLLLTSQALRLKLDVYGVRYPPEALSILARSGAHYRGWMPNAMVPEIFARHTMTVHVPRRAYANQLPGIPTIRVFEALSCGIPLICAPWLDSEGLFRPGIDYLVAQTPEAMQQHMAALLADGDLRQSLVTHGLEIIRSRHTCAHRVDELLAIVAKLREGGGI